MRNARRKKERRRKKRSETKAEDKHAYSPRINLCISQEAAGLYHAPEQVLPNRGKEPASSKGTAEIGVSSQVQY
jgi:hypothetical protein